jgi:HK97 gp10 family phage protein
MPFGALEFNLYAELAAKQIAGVGAVIDETLTEIEQGVKSPDSPTAAPYKTGNLRRSYHRTRLRKSLGQISGEVGNDLSVAEYAVYVEFGTSKMAPRPHLVPSTERQRKRFMDRIAEVLLGGHSAFVTGSMAMSAVDAESVDEGDTDDLGGWGAYVTG